MSENQLIILSKSFAVSIINLCETIRERKKASAIINQLLRSGTSIGANIHEANYASSKADFINKFQIALKECYETDYWLGIFHDSKILSDEEYANMFSQCSKLRKLLIASITTAKKNGYKLRYKFLTELAIYLFILTIVSTMNCALRRVNCLAA